MSGTKRRTGRVIQQRGRFGKDIARPAKEGHQMENIKEYIKDHAIQLLALAVALIALIRLAVVTSLLTAIFKML